MHGSDLNQGLDLTPGEQLPASISDWLTGLRIENQPAGVSELTPPATGVIKIKHIPQNPFCKRQK
jgi:hypothetical protein